MRGRVVGGVSLCLLSIAVSACALPSIAVRPSPTPTPDPIEVGQRVYLQLCAQCHGEEGEGYANELQAPALDASEHAWHHPDQQIYEWVVFGKLGLGRQMPPQGDQLSDEEVYAMIAYLHTLWTPEQLATQQDITNRWPATPRPRSQP
jgi:mono/diheme cytochrome c family protein